MHTDNISYTTYSWDESSEKSSEAPITTKDKTLLNLFWQEVRAANTSIFDDGNCGDVIVTSALHDPSYLWLA